MLRCGQETAWEIKTERRDYSTNLYIHQPSGYLPVKPYPCAMGKCYSSMWCISILFLFFFIGKNPLFSLVLKEVQKECTERVREREAKSLMLTYALHYDLYRNTKAVQFKSKFKFNTENAIKSEGLIKEDSSYCGSSNALNNITTATPTPWKPILLACQGPQMLRVFVLLF